MVDPHDNDPFRVARNTPGQGLKDFEPQIDMNELRRYRLNRVRGELHNRDYAGCLLYNPVNIRYATGTRNMSVFCAHSPTRYAFIATDGPVVLFDTEAPHTGAGGTDVVDEYRRAHHWYYEGRGPFVKQAAAAWAAQIDDILRQCGGANRRLAIDRLGAMGFMPLHELGVEIHDAQEVLEEARAIKSPEEIACVSITISVCEAGMDRMREALRPGISEQELWSQLVQFNAAHGGEWMETRLLTSGGRTNPWYQECGEKLIRSGDLVAFDTDLIGPFGYCADISRTLHCGPSRPTGEQRRLYTLAYEEVQHNLGLIKAGASFRDISEACWKAPQEFLPNRYSCLMHGVGLVDEYPDIVHPLDWPTLGYDGEIRENMTLCVESYIGAVNGTEGVKLEEQVLVTGDGIQMLSAYPFEEHLLA